jgi:hypothetical protein
MTSDFRGSVPQLLPSIAVETLYVHAKQTGMPYDQSQVCKHAFDHTQEGMLAPGCAGKHACRKISMVGNMQGRMLMGRETQMAMGMAVADLCKVLSQVWQNHVLLLPDQFFEHTYLHQAPTSPCCKLLLKDTQLKSMHQLCAVTA